MRRAHRGKLGGGIGVVFIVVLALCLAAIAVVSVSSVHTPPPDVHQKAQFNALNAAIELLNAELDGYPPSEANDPAGQPYPGSMKLAEALMGQDLLGFHSGSIFRRDGSNSAGISLYPPALDNLPISARESNLQARKGPFLQAENANAHRLVDIYGKGNTGGFPEDVFVLCDVYA